MYALECRNISKSYTSQSGFFPVQKVVHKVLDNISFKVELGKTLGILGPSGCGKSTLGRIVCGLLPQDIGQVFLFDQECKKPADFIGKVQMVFQNPFSSLNPRLRIEASLKEPYIYFLRRQNKKVLKEEVDLAVHKVLREVGLKVEDKHKFPHQFSGGQRQRIALARALISQPPLLICDEAVSALDVSIQAQILNLLRDLREEYKLTMIFISHNQYVTEAMSHEILTL